MARPGSSSPGSEVVLDFRRQSNSIAALTAIPAADRSSMGSVGDAPVSFAEVAESSLSRLPVIP